MPRETVNAGTWITRCTWLSIKQYAAQRQPNIRAILPSSSMKRSRSKSSRKMGCFRLPRHQMCRMPSV